ncbi:MAG: tetratricopeptide repeat protein [Cyanobacteria bacterium J06627_8]
MALKIDRGLFTSDFVDHHAILGIAMGADAKAIRKRYLKIARQLHPDNSAAKNEGEKQLAQELLSKLVNPAYEKLSQIAEQKEYALLLELKGRELNQQQETVLITSKYAQKIAASSNIEQTYHEIIDGLATQQYESLSESLDLIGHISEVNMVYLMRQNGPGIPKPPPKATPGRAPVTKPPEDKPENKGPDLLERAMIRAERFEINGEFPKAIQELRDAIQLNPRHDKVSDCHRRLGNIYLKSKQMTMAKIHFRKALELNPNDEVAQAGMKRLEPKGPGTTSNKGKTNGAKGGFLSGIFGKKKK